MVCIYCGQDTRITNSRLQKRQSGTWRRHQCKSCSAIFTSLERVDYGSSLSFKNASSHIIPFDRDNLYISLYEACKHRPSAIEDATALANTIIMKLLTNSRSPVGLITRSELIATAVTALERFDRVACTHYTAYHVV